MFCVQVNRICMWTLTNEEEEEEDGGLEPVLNCGHDVPADVTDLCFIDEHFLVASLRDGSVIMLKHFTNAKVGTKDTLYSKNANLSVFVF